MTPIRNILVCIDLDLITEPVLSLTLTMARALQARVELVHVFETPGYHGPEVLELAQAQDPAVLHWRTARTMLDLMGGLASQGLEVRGRMAFGVVEEKVRDLAREEGFGLIIIGSHSREGLDRFVHGSVSAALIRTAPCPVLVLPHLKDVIPS